jgi:hypothetical protein
MLETFKGFLLFIVFLVPGFVFRSVEGQFVYLDRRLDWGRFALGLLTRSTFAYLPVAPILYFAWNNQWMEIHPVQASITAFGFLIFLPGLLGALSGIARQKQWPRWCIEKIGLKTFEQHQIPTAWDHLFSNVTTSWVIVRLRDGHQIRGFLGPDSYVSSDPTERDVYISHVLIERDDGTISLAKNTEGIYIKGQDISTIEFIQHHEHTEESFAIPL